MSDAVNIAAAQNALSNRVINAPAPSKDHKEMQDAAKQFEAIFLTEMLNFMSEGLPTDGPFGGGNGEAMMRSMLTEQYAKSITSRGGMGISDKVMSELLAIQEGTGNASAKSQ